MKTLQAAWLALTRKADGLSKISLLCALIAHVVAYSRVWFNLSDYWFWVVNDIAFVLYFCFAYFVSVNLNNLIKPLAIIGFWFALSALFEDIVGQGNEYSIKEYVFAVVTVAMVYRNWLKRHIAK